jgi:hypothetical protein
LYTSAQYLLWAEGFQQSAHSATNVTPDGTIYCAIDSVGSGRTCLISTFRVSAFRGALRVGCSAFAAKPSFVGKPSFAGKPSRKRENFMKPLPGKHRRES